MKIIIKKLPLTFNLKRKLFKKHIKRAKFAHKIGPFISYFIAYKTSSFSFYKGFDLAFCLFSGLTLLFYLLSGVYLPISIKLCLFINCFILALNLLNPCKLQICHILRYGYSNYPYLTSLLCQIMIIILIFICEHSFYYLAFLMFILFTSQTPWYLILIGLITKTIKFILLQQDETWLNMKKNLQEYNKEIEAQSEIQITSHNLSILEFWLVRGYVVPFPNEERFLANCWLAIKKRIYYKCDFNDLNVHIRIELHLKQPSKDNYLESGGGLLGVFGTCCVNGEWVCQKYPVIKPVIEQLWVSKVHGSFYKGGGISNGFTLHPIFTKTQYSSYIRNFLTLDFHKNPAFKSQFWGTGLKFPREDFPNVIKPVQQLTLREKNLLDTFEDANVAEACNNSLENHPHSYWFVDVQKFQKVQDNNPYKDVRNVLCLYLYSQRELQDTPQTLLLENARETPAIIQFSLNQEAQKLSELISNIETETEKLIYFSAHADVKDHEKDFLFNQIQINQIMLKSLKN